MSVVYVFSAYWHHLSVFLQCYLKSRFCYVNVHAKEVNNMKNGRNVTAQIAKSIAEKALRRDANQTTCTIFFQPKAPASLNAFKKH